MDSRLVLGGAQREAVKPDAGGGFGLKMLPRLHIVKVRELAFAEAIVTCKKKIKAMRCLGLHEIIKCASVLSFMYLPFSWTLTDEMGVKRVSVTPLPTVLYCP